MTYSRSIFRHNPARQRVLQRPFALYSPRYSPFDPILFLEELVFSAHCPRKSLFLFRRGQKVKWNIQYLRDPTLARSRGYFQGGSWYQHSNLFKKVIIKVLKNLPSNFNHLENVHPTQESWQVVLRELILQDPNVEQISNFLLEDITSFFIRWFENGELEIFFSNTGNISFNTIFFNPKVELQNSNPVDLERGTFIGRFPLKGNIDIIDFQKGKIYEILCHHDSWIPQKDIERTRNTVCEDSPIRREQIIWEPLYYKLWLIRKAIETMETDYLQGVYIGNSVYGSIPNSIFSLIPGSQWSSRISNFELEIAAIDSSHLVNLNIDYTPYIIDGLISCKKACVGAKYDLAVSDRNPCADPMRVIRDIHCSMFQECIAKSIYFLMGNFANEVSRFEEKLFHERILITSLNLYRMAFYLPNNPYLFNSEHVSFWCGTVISQVPLRIRLDSNLEVEGLIEGNQYLIPRWSPFLGAEEIKTLVSIDNDNFIVEFQEESELIPNTNITILNKLQDDEIIRREQRALSYHLLSRYHIETQTAAGRQSTLLRILQEGGRRTGQAVFGGWARFL